jgi:hypothetical protein
MPDVKPTIKGKLSTPGTSQTLPRVNASMDDKGKWTVRHAISCNIADVALLTPRLGAPCPHTTYSFTTLAGIDIEEDGKTATITGTYTGTQVSEDDEDDSSGKYSYETNISLGDVPITEYYRYEDVVESEKNAINRYLSSRYGSKSDDPENAGYYTLIDEGTHVNGREFIIESELGKELLDFIRRGIVTRLQPSIIRRVSYTAKSEPTGPKYNDVGYIKEPREAPAISDDRNWLFNGMTSTQDGSVWRITEEYLLSGRGGFYTELYGDS